VAAFPQLIKLNIKRARIINLIGVIFSQILYKGIWGRIKFCTGFKGSIKLKAHFSGKNA